MIATFANHPSHEERNEPMKKQLVIRCGLTAVWLALPSMVRAADAASDPLGACNVVWDSPSKNSSGSMPIGNGDIGMNAWVEENGDLLLLIGKTDAWDENSRIIKVGRVRITLSPSPFAKGQPFRQELKLREGMIEITGGAPDGWLEIGGVRVPFVSMNNEPESLDPAVLRERYARALGRLLELYRTLIH